MPRFQILKSKKFGGLYAIFDAETEMILGTADSLKEAQAFRDDIENLINKEMAINEAMANPKIAE